jgi:cobaltochelatase CobT
MHAIYLSFDEAEWNDQSWEAMLNPNVLRENVDGETLLWAANKLKSRQENRRILVIVSDGAPVDDSTLMENGEGYLWRHLQKVVSDMQMNDDIELLAVGVNHRVDEIYQRSAVIQVGENLSAAVWDLMR